MANASVKRCSNEDAAVIDRATTEWVATCDETAEVDAEYERITRSLYVTDQRTFLLVEHCFPCKGRPATSTKVLSLAQARAWCIAQGLHVHTIERYVVQVPVAKDVPQAASLLTQHWGSPATRDTTAA